MNPDLPFMHDAHDPSEAGIDRARRRVQQSVGRRRHRRRAVATAGVLAGVLFVAGVAGAALRGPEPLEEVLAGTATTAPALEVEANTSWNGATLSEDGLTLTVHVGSRPAGNGPCEQTFDHDVAETADGVIVGFEEAPSPHSEDLVCELMAVSQTFEIELEAPLGDRPVYDGVEPEPRQIHRLEELVEVTWLPPGWERTAVDGTWQRYYTWQQTFHGDGADWYVMVTQAPEGSFEPGFNAGNGEPVTVRGINDARRYRWFNGTASTIHWVEAGLDIAVTGEMQGPPTFAHEAELLRIAEGIDPG